MSSEETPGDSFRNRSVKGWQDVTAKHEIDIHLDGIGCHFRSIVQRLSQYSRRWHVWHAGGTLGRDAGGQWADRHLPCTTQHVGDTDGDRVGRGRHSAADVRRDIRGQVYAHVTTGRLRNVARQCEAFGKHGCGTGEWFSVQ